MDGNGVGEPADPADLQIDPAPGVDLDGLARLVERHDAFVEAQGRLQLALQTGVIDQVIVGKRLLDHDETAVVQFAKQRQVVECETAVAVDMHGGFGEALAQRADRLRPHAGAELQLDAGKTGVERAPDLADQTFGVILNTDVGAHRDRR
jgi:hypothetical protein